MTEEPLPDRLRKELLTVTTEAADVLEAKDAEIARYREALNEIWRTASSSPKWVKDIARQALEVPA